MVSQKVQRLIGLLEDDEHRLRAIEKLAESGLQGKSAIANLWIVARNKDQTLPVNQRVAALRAVCAIDKKNPNLASTMTEFIQDFKEDLLVRLEAVRLVEGLGICGQTVYGSLWNFVNSYPLGEELNRALTKALIRIHGDPNKLFAQILQALNRLDARCWAEVSVLSELQMSDSQIEAVLQVLWTYVQKVTDVRIIPYAFQAILDISENDDVIFNQLWQNKKIPVANKVLIVSHSFFLDNLVTNFEKSRKEILSTVLKALEQKEEWIRNGALKLLLKLQAERRFFKEDFNELIKGVRVCLDTYNQGLALVFIYHNDDSEGREWLEQHPNAKSAIGLFFFWDESGMAFLDELWTNRTSTSQQTLSYVFQALADLEDPTKVLDWLRTRIAGVNLAECEEIESRLKIFQDDNKDELNSDAVFQIQDVFRLIRRRRESLNLENLIKDIRSVPLQEDELIQKIRLLTMTGSVVELRELIDIWIGWIEKKEKPTLIDTTAELIRFSPAAVLPLVDRLNELVQERDSGEPEWNLAVYRRIIKQISLLSDERFYTEKEKSKIYLQNRAELEKYALSALVRQLPKETDLEVRESIARTLGNLGGREAMNALVHAIVDEEKKRQARQDLLARYYLEPTKTYEDRTAEILQSAVRDAKRTLRILQALNISVFVVGLLVIVLGISVSLYNKDAYTRLAGALAGLGGLAGVIVHLIKNPLDRIQNAMANLVQLEAAFTSFVWELNLNSTYIQSQYVAKGVLGDDDVANTVSRIENAMTLAMNLVAVYTEEGQQRILTRIHNLCPAAGNAGSIIKISGQHLQGDEVDKKNQMGMITINHVPVQAQAVSWKTDNVTFKLPEKLPGLADGSGTVWISLLIDGMETNALPFNVVKN